MAPEISHRAAAVAGVAIRQYGNITRSQLFAARLDDSAIKREVRSGRLFRVHPGVYAVGRPPVTPHEHAAAAVLACGPGAALSHRSAMTLWGFFKRWERPFQVTVSGDRRPAGIEVHRSHALLRRDLTKQLGIRVTSPARTVLDCSPTLSDRSVRRAVNDARLSRYLRLPELADVIERFPRHPGAARLRGLLASPGGPTRSEFEDAFPAFCDCFSLPRPVMGARVAGYEVDALFPAQRVIVELDGWEYHSSRDAFERDRNRDAETLASGLVTVRITWQRLLVAPNREAERLHAILAGRSLKAA
ncbi:MAG: type IV toxin-antitoxin system AbiEi family antitoxin domain-containing protein [Solirubrobacterales bacterium]|nr:type IV toxin-antitoxin system AbiEi family antitoxin domain-containing protein [Solirubrobacterales bacterium]